MEPNPFLFFLREGDFIDVYCKLIYKSRFFTHVLTDTTEQENPFKGKPRISETRRTIKKNVNVSCTETVNQATKYLRDFINILPYILNGHILDEPSSDLS